MKQLIQLARPFPPKLVHTNPSGGGSYVAHDVVVQRLLQVVGPFDFRVAQVIRGYVPAIAPNPSGSSKRAKEGRPELNDAVVGVIAELSVCIDGAYTTVQDAGDCEDPHNWPHDGARMKDACSDAIKRCAMRLGCGLHLWAQEDYYLHEALNRDHPEAAADANADARALIDAPICVECSTPITSPSRRSAGGLAHRECPVKDAA